MAHLRSTTFRSATIALLAAGLALTGCASNGATPRTSSASAGPSISRSPATTADPADVDLAKAVRAIEKQHKGTAGVHAIDTQTGRSVGYRQSTRFGYASTYKAFTAAAVLHRSQPGDLDRKIPVQKSRIEPNSPVMKQYAGRSVPLRTILRAALAQSDNTAGNIMFDQLGGVDGAQRRIRGMGDGVTRVRHKETALNTWKPGGTDDTTTPQQAATNLRMFFESSYLTQSQKDVLFGDMAATRTADNRIRAAVKDRSGWKVCDKSGSAGSAGRAGSHDIAMIQRPGKKPVFIAVYTYLDDAQAPMDEKFIADVASSALGILKT